MKGMVTGDYGMFNPFPHKETIGYILPDWKEVLAEYREKVGEEPGSGFNGVNDV